VMVTYYVTLFVSLLLNYMPHHIFCLGVMHVTTYVTLTMSSLRYNNTLFPQLINRMPHQHFAYDTVLRILHCERPKSIVSLELSWLWKEGFFLHGGL
jgi:hypothetical protein